MSEDFKTGLGLVIYGVAALLLGFCIGADWFANVDPDLRRIQQQRNAWAQYQEAGEVRP